MATAPWQPGQPLPPVPDEPYPQIDPNRREGPQFEPGGGPEYPPPEEPREPIEPPEPVEPPEIEID